MCPRTDATPRSTPFRLGATVVGGALPNLRGRGRQSAPPRAREERPAPPTDTTGGRRHLDDHKRPPLPHDVVKQRQSPVLPVGNTDGHAWSDEELHVTAGVSQEF